MAADRRDFLRGLAAFGLSFAGLAARGEAAPGESPYGPLAPERDLATGLPLLQLPRGFRYRSYAWRGDPMSDGSPTPPRHDGMSVVDVVHEGGRHRLVLMRNHENGPGPWIGRGAAPVYDDLRLPFLGGLGGGTTALVFERGRFTASLPTLAGTLANCAGGKTSWGSWLSCEEGLYDLRPLGGKPHGFVFEVPSPRLGAASARPLRDMGLFAHEAVAVDPATGLLYETEDNGDVSGFYRFRPNDGRRAVGALEAGGALEMLAVTGEPSADLVDAAEGDAFDVHWVPIPEPDRLPAERHLLGFRGPSGPFAQGRERGGARFNRLEGCWHHEGVLYFVDTSGGPARRGAVWAYRPPDDEAHGRGRLTAIFVAGDAEAADHPDNVTVSSRGGIVLCEDSGSPEGTRLLGLTRDGRSYELARNNVLIDRRIRGKRAIRPGDYRSREFTGACFDPKGRILFVNVQVPGITFAIAGPWRRGDL